MTRFNTIDAFGHLGTKIGRSGKIVEIIVFCLMPNHFHLLLKQVEENGISKYMHRLETGYTMYFNKCNDRSGVLLQGTFKCKAITTNPYLLQLSKYIHTNPLHIVGKKQTDISIIKKQLCEYPWSSLREYCNIWLKNSTVDNKEPILGQFINNHSYKKYVLDIQGLALNPRSKKWLFD
jgi:putative transposase